MKIFVIFGYLFGVVIIAYFCGIFSVWACQIKMNILCKKMRQKINLLGNSNISMAVFYVKKYKIVEDYRRSIAEIERIQKFILKNILMIRRSPLKMYSHIN